MGKWAAQSLICAPNIFWYVLSSGYLAVLPKKYFKSNLYALMSKDEGYTEIEKD
jgi:hypothetical protein